MRSPVRIRPPRPLAPVFDRLAPMPGANDDAQSRVVRSLSPPRIFGVSPCMRPVPHRPLWRTFCGCPGVWMGVAPGGCAVLCGAIVRMSCCICRLAWVCLSKVGVSAWGTGALAPSMAHSWQTETLTIRYGGTNSSMDAGSSRRQTTDQVVAETSDEADQRDSQPPDERWITPRHAVRCSSPDCLSFVS